MFNEEECALDTRSWTTLLVACLMRCFTDLRAADTAVDPSLFNHVLLAPLHEPFSVV
jgi:hypothetical protein